jgi:hypothetical protein
VPLVLYCLSVLQPATEMAVIEAAKRIAAESRLGAPDEQLGQAFGRVRQERRVWRSGRDTYSLSSTGHDALRVLGLSKVRDKDRLYRLRALARGEERTSGGA